MPKGSFDCSCAISLGRRNWPWRLHATQIYTSCNTAMLGMADDSSDLCPVFLAAFRSYCAQLVFPTPWTLHLPPSQQEICCCHQSYVLAWCDRIFLLVRLWLSTSHLGSLDASFRSPVHVKTWLRDIVYGRVAEGICKLWFHVFCLGCRLVVILIELVYCAVLTEQF